MKRLLIFVLLISFAKAGAQNLVPNWSFEDTIQCPDNFGQLNRTQNWFNPTTGTPDYYNSCDGRLLWMGVPYNGGGFQYANTGDAYAGILLYGFFPTNGREYIEVLLTDSLIAGKDYCISFYVSLANSSSMAISNIGCYLSQSAVTSTNTFFIPVIPQIENSTGNYLADTMNWMKISGTYIASGGEKYITIGNFHNDAATDTFRLDSNSDNCYYYIDDVSVIPCEDTLPVSENIFFVPNAFSPNGDGNNDTLFVRGRNISDLQFSVYDRWGTKVFETTDLNIGWDGTYEGKKMESAVFVYYLTLTYMDGKTDAKQGNVSLIR